MPVGLTLLGIGAGLSAFGQIRGGILAKKQGKILEEESDKLADVIMQMQRQDDARMAEAQHHRRGAMAAATGATGLALEGSALEMVLTQSRLDAMTRSRQQFLAEMRARGIDFTGEQRKAEGKNAFNQGLLSALGTGVQAASVAGASQPTTVTTSGDLS